MRTDSKHSAAPLDWRPVAALKKWAKNPKKHGAANLAAITASIEAFGFVAPVVIWGSQSRIIAGHGRIAAALDLMRADPARLLAPDAPGPGLVPVRVVEFDSEAQAAAYALADNRLTEMEPMQAVDVAEVLRQIQEETGEVTVPGWTDAEIAAMLGEAAAPEDAPDTSPQMGDLQYRIVVECNDEVEQASLMERFRAQGVRCQPLIS